MLDRNFEDIFNTLLSDIIAHVIDLSDPRQMIRQFLNRVDKWHALLEKATANGLTPEEQRGLFGEIFLLRKLITSLPEAEKALLAWVGPEKAPRDFQYGGCALEVKTSHGNNHQRIHVSNERQLDTSTIEQLYIFHLSIESQQSAGESLNDLVDSVSLALQDDFKLTSHFRFKLAQGGYLPAHRELYADKGYIVRAETFYEVKGSFPRIEESDLRPGVGDVRYSIIISDCATYQINELTVYQNLNQVW
ncbi:PD-(D/E)XK motif protein [Pontibacter pudoricolor]|uniref:PD-(D/E)XK motif protein n=1 Tax=Pontibacter pudoricolor TaxID=2694930 RepID=UPI001390A984|nr:PD-(D/E)XK motif protein [Pontibacter pudoricolor]